MSFRKKGVIAFCSVFAFGACSSAKKALIVRSDPAEAEVCIKGKAGSEFFSNDKKTCFGTTPLEIKTVEVRDKNGKLRTIDFDDVESQKESFYVVVSRPGYSSQAVTVPGWDHFVTLRPEDQLRAQPVAVLESGKIEILSEPAGALVYINERLEGNTPYLYEGPAGSASVRIEMTGHESMKSSITVDSKQNRQVNFKLLASAEAPEKNKRTVEITSEPSGAMVYVNGTPVGNTPYPYTGRINSRASVRIQHPGYEEASDILRLKESEEGSPTNLNFKLRRMPASASN